MRVRLCFAFNLKPDDRSYYLRYRCIRLESSGSSLPRSSCEALETSVVYCNALPRRIRHEGTRNKNPDVVQILIDASTLRSRRLLGSFDELEREVRDSAARIRCSSSRAKVVDDAARWTDGRFRFTLNQARKAQIQCNDLTGDFAWARSYDLRDGLREWKWYKEMCFSRHGWGEYFRSNLDWDWDLGQAMNRLRVFDSNAKSPTVMPRNGRRTTYNLPIAIVDEVHGTMELTLGTMPGPSLNKIRVAYTGETGETHFVTFVPALTADVRKIPENKYQELILTSEGMKNSDQHSKSQVGEHRSLLQVYWTSQGRNNIH